MLALVPPLTLVFGLALAAAMLAGVAIGRARRAPRKGQQRAATSKKVEEDKLRVAAERRALRNASEGAPMDAGAASRLISALRKAIARDKLHLCYQPKLRSRTDEIDAVEALVRWNHPREGLIPPNRFVPLAEESGDIRALTEWVIRRAIADRAHFLEKGRPLTIHINLSGRLVADSSFAEWALEMLGALDGCIGLEITETGVIDDPEIALANLRAFAAAGIPIAIDDYGSGLSSLAYLKELPANELKIDKAFISKLASSNRDPLLVRSTIDLAHALEMQVTAEGVESAGALALLRVMGCDVIQGYLISHPLPRDELLAFLDNWDKGADLVIPSLDDTPHWRAA